MKRAFQLTNNEIKTKKKKKIRPVFKNDHQNLVSSPGSFPVINHNYSFIFKELNEPASFILFIYLPSTMVVYVFFFTSPYLIDLKVTTAQVTSMKITRYAGSSFSKRNRFQFKSGLGCSVNVFQLSS